MLLFYFATLLTALFSFFNTISCSILIVSDGIESETGTIDRFKKLIRAAGNDQIKVEESKGDAKLPDIVGADDEALPLFHTIFYFKSKAPAVDWSISQITNFVQNGGNFFISTTGQSKWFSEFGLELIEGNLLHQSASKAQWNSQHSFSTLSATKTIDLPVQGDAFVAFKLRNDPKLASFNPLIQNALSFAPGSAICTAKGTCQSNSVGISLLATLESRKGSRFAAISSQQLLASLPEPVLKGIFGWVQGTAFSFRIASVAHELTNGKSSNRGRTELDSTIYRIKDHVNIRMCLVTGSDSQRFIPENVQNFQFELKMMNIQVRKTFDSIDSDGCLNSLNVQLPPKPAIYTLQIHHNRPGWSQLNHEERLLVRPFRHDEFPRFLKIALPYYVSWIGLLVASYFILLPSFFKQLK